MAYAVTFMLTMSYIVYLTAFWLRTPYEVKGRVLDIQESENKVASAWVIILGTLLGFSTILCVFYVMSLLGWTFLEIFSTVMVIVMGSNFVRNIFYFRHIEKWWDILVSVALAGLLLLVVKVYPNWLTYNLVAFVIASTILVMAPKIPFRYLVFGAVGLLTYDVVHVFGTGLMMKVATSALPAPGFIVIVPKNLFNLSASPVENLLGILGLGDIVVSGLVIMYAREYGLSKVALLAYGVGLILTVVIGKLIEHPMPALLVLLPVSSVYLSARSRQIVLA